MLSNGAAVDARPSDALNLAAITDVPVYAAPELLHRHTGASSTGSLPERPTITATRYDPAPQPHQE